MGRSYTCKYRIEIKGNVYMTPHGTERKLNAKQLEEYRVKLNQSFQPGQINARSTGIVPHVSKCTMINQRTGEVVSVANAPMFEIV